jgi:hypothetical protein
MEGANISTTAWNGGTVCPTCGTWHNGYHSCAGGASAPPPPVNYVYSYPAPVDERVIALLERIAAALERRAQ